MSNPERFLLAGLLFAVPASSQQDFTLIAPAPRAEAEFGRSLDVHETTAVVGAPSDGAAGDEAGVVYVYRRAAGSWVLEAELRPSDASAGDRFGSAVGVHGRFLIVGAPGRDDGVNEVGAAYFFERTPAGWVERHRFVEPHRGSVPDHIGASVSLFEETAIVGMYGDIYPTEPHRAYVLARSGDRWFESARLVSETEFFDDQFGVAVEIGDGVAIVGAQAHMDYDHSLFFRGAVHVYRRGDGGAWSRAQTLSPIFDDFQFFGGRLQLVDPYLLIGNGGDPSGPTEGGSFYIFRSEGTTFSNEAQFFGYDDEATPVSVTGDGFAAAGRPSANEVDVYRRDPDTGEWNGIGMVRPEDAAPDDRFSESLSFLSSTELLAGAPGDDEGALDGGAVSGFTDLEFGPDSRPPSGVSLITPAPGALTNETAVTLVWNEAFDFNGVDFYEVDFRGQAHEVDSTDDLLPEEFRLPGSPSEGKHDWRVRAVDLAGNAGPWSETRSLTVDRTAPPAPRLLSPVNGRRVRRRALVTFRCTPVEDSSGIAFYRVWIDGVTSNSNTVRPGAVFVPSALAPGLHTWRMEAVDKAGNVSEPSPQTFQLIVR
jgi:hypothetical protein